MPTSWWWVMAQGRALSICSSRQTWKLESSSPVCWPSGALGCVMVHFTASQHRQKIRINGDISKMNKDVNVDNTSISLIFTIKVLLEFFTLTLSQHMWDSREGSEVTVLRYNGGRLVSRWWQGPVILQLYTSIHLITVTIHSARDSLTRSGDYVLIVLVSLQWGAMRTVFILTRREWDHGTCVALTPVTWEHWTLF